jgi:hypothetical protein
MAGAVGDAQTRVERISMVCDLPVPQGGGCTVSPTFSHLPLDQPSPPHTVSLSANLDGRKEPNPKRERK